MKHLVLGIVGHLVEPCGPAGADRGRRLARCRIDDLDGTVAIAGPDLLAGEEHAVRTGNLTLDLAVLHHGTHKGPDPTDKSVVSGVEDVDRLVAAICEVKAAGRLVHEADVEVRELFARNGDRADLFQFRPLREPSQERACSGKRTIGAKRALRTPSSPASLGSPFRPSSMAQTVSLALFLASLRRKRHLRQRRHGQVPERAQLSACRSRMSERRPSAGGACWATPARQQAHCPPELLAGHNSAVPLTARPTSSRLTACSLSAAFGRERTAMGPSEYNPGVKEGRPWNAGRKLGAKRA